MLALCLMLSETYYAQNYASIIGLSLINSLGDEHTNMHINFADKSNFKKTDTCQPLDSEPDDWLVTWSPFKHRPNMWTSGKPIIFVRIIN